MSKLFKWLGGFLLGSVTGAGAALLFLPRAGAETRLAIRRQIDAVLEEGRQEAQVRHRELTARFEALKQPGQRG